MNTLTTPPISQYVKTLKHKVSIPKITLPFMNRFVTVPVSEILYIQSDINYCYVHLKDGRTFLIAKTLKEYNQELNNHAFARIHKSYLVNLEAISYCSFPDYEIQMNNGLSLPIARRKRKAFRQKFNHYNKVQRLAS